MMDFDHHRQWAGEGSEHIEDAEYCVQYVTHQGELERRKPFLHLPRRIISGLNV